MKWQLIIVLLLIFPSINAFMIEQQIDIINLEVSTTSTSWTAGSGILGMVEIDLSKYDNITAIYFQTTAEYDYLGIPNGIGCGSVGLYDMTNSVQITNATMGLGGSAGYHSSVNLSYLWSNPLVNVTPNMIACSSSEVHLYGARVVIIQDAPEINKTRTYIPIGTSITTTNVKGPGAPYTEIIQPKRWWWLDDDFGGDVTTTFATTAYSSISGKNIYSTMLNYSGNTDVVVFTISSNTPVYRKQEVNLVDGQNYSSGLTRGLAFPTSPTATQRNAFIIVDQEGIQEDLNLTLVYQTENRQRAETSGSAIYEDESQIQYNGTRIDGLNIDSSIWECNFKTQAFTGTEYALCKLAIGSTQIATSVVTTSSTSIIVMRRDFDYSSYYTAENKLRAGIYNLDAGTQTVITSGRLILHIDGLEVAANCWTLTGSFLAIPAGCLFNVSSGSVFAI